MADQNIGTVKWFNSEKGFDLFKQKMEMMNFSFTTVKFKVQDMEEYLQMKDKEYLSKLEEMKKVLKQKTLDQYNFF